MMDRFVKTFFPETRIELTNEQTQQVLDATDVVAVLTPLVGLFMTDPVSPAIVAALGAWIKLNRIRVARANKGNGVIISIPRSVIDPLGMAPLFFSVRPR